MKVVYLSLLAFCLFVICAFDGCSVTPQPGTPAGGFPVTTQSVLLDSAGNPITSASPVPGMAVTGVWLSDGNGAAGSLRNFSVLTDFNGNAFVNGGRVNAYWSSAIGWNNPECGASSETFWVDPIVGIEWICPITVIEESMNSSSHFVLPGAVPSNITSYGDFSTTYGNPKLRVYAPGSLVSTAAASNVLPGSSATFPFPTQSNGSPLAEGFYGLVNTNATSGGGTVWVDSSYLAVGGSTTLSNAFGVDAADLHYSHTVCNPKTGVCTTTDNIYAAPILTQYYSNQVVGWVTGKTPIPVGSEPVAVRTYGSYTATLGAGQGQYTLSGPAYAIVANSGSSSVSIVSFSSNADVKNIAVGSQPMALALNSTDTMAYVASYGNGTLAEINLSTEAVTHGEWAFWSFKRGNGPGRLIRLGRWHELPV